MTKPTNLSPIPKRRVSVKRLVRPASAGSLIPASKLLRAESTRLDVLKHAMPGKAQKFIEAQVWAYNMAAAYLDALGAPEKLVRYVPQPNMHISNPSQDK